MTVFGKVSAYCDTVEYTSSGIPHLHALLWLTHDYKPLASLENNRVVFAKKVNPRECEDRKLNELIKKYQMHVCVKEKCNIQKNGEIVNYCLNGYPFEPNQADSINQENNRILYKRDIGDEMVIPYNPELLKIACCHTNVQIVTSDSVAVYLAKYITKVNRFSISDKNKEKKNENTREEDFNEVEIFLKERKIGAIEACNDILLLNHHKNMPACVDLFITIPSNRICKLIPLKQIQKALENQKEKDESSEYNKGIFKPDNWENYFCRDDKLENLTFTEMITQYKWTSRFDLIPNSCKRPDKNNQILFWKQKELSTIYEKLIKNLNLKSESNAINEITQNQLKINYDEKWQLAKYCYKRSCQILLNCKYKFQKNKDELFWFLYLIDHEHFRLFDDLLTHEGKVYETFMSACKAKGYYEEVEDINEITLNRYDIGSLTNSIIGMANGKILISYEEIKLIILRLIQTIQMKKDETMICKLKELSIQYYNQFPQLFEQVLSNRLMTLREDPINIFKKEINSNTWWKSKFIIKWGYLKYMKDEIDKDSSYELAWKYFHRYEPIIVEKLNDEKDVFRRKYLQLNYFSVSQKRIIDFFIKNMFHPDRNCYFITGYAGCGKSFLLRELVLLFKNVLNLNVLVCATTGTAAKNIEGVTVHNAFRYYSKNVLDIPQPGTYQFENLKKQDIVIIDEASMMTGELLDFIDATLRNTALYTKYKQESFYKPFGGKMIILFGDLLQIPCVQEEVVGTRIRRYRKINEAYIFQKFMWLFLKEQKRQAKDYKYFEHCKSIAIGDINEEVLAWLSTKVQNKKHLKSINHEENVESLDECKAERKTDIIWVSSTNVYKDMINMKRLQAFLGKKNKNKVTYNALYYSKMYEVKDEDTLRYLRNIFCDDHACEESITLAKGSKAILNVNLDIKAGLTNGTIGFIHDLQENIIEFEYEFKGEKHIAFIQRLEQIETVPYLDIARYQFPMSPAYCLTMHKCQGQTLDGVVIDCTDIQTEGLFYSILARCKNSNRIHIKNLIVDEHILSNAETVELVKRKEQEFDTKFSEIEWEYGEMDVIGRILNVIRETRISYPYLHDFIHSELNGNCDEWIESLDKVNEMKYEFFKILDKQISQREAWMLEQYEEFNNEENKNEDLIVDWRTKTGYDSEKLMKDLLEKCYSDENIDKDQIDFNDENEIYFSNEDEIAAIISQHESQIQEEENAMNVDSKMHHYDDDGCIPWCFWNKNSNGFDSLLLLLYYKIFFDLTDLQASYFFAFKPKKLVNQTRYKSMLDAICNLDKIDKRIEFSSEKSCQRLNNVLIPWISTLKENDRIENQFNCFENSHMHFVLKYKEVFKCHGKCKEGQNETVVRNDKTIISYIKISGKYKFTKRILKIDNDIVKNCLLKDLFKECPKCGSRMVTIDIVPTVFPLFLWIVNDQEPFSNNIKQNQFRVNTLLKLGKDKTNIYKLQGIIFVSSYKYSAWVNIKIREEEDSEEWFDYDGDKCKNMIQKQEKKFGRILVLNRELDDIQNKKWPKIFLYKRLNQ